MSIFYKLFLTFFVALVISVGAGCASTTGKAKANIVNPSTSFIATIPIAVLAESAPVETEESTTSDTKWYPWFTLNKNGFTRNQLAEVLKQPKWEYFRKGITPAVLAREIGNRGIPAPQDEKDFLSWIGRSPRIKEISCTADLLSTHFVSRTTLDGDRFDHMWSRPSCAENEKFLAYEHGDGSIQPFLSLWCGNLLTAKGKPPTTVLYGSCPEVYTLKVNIWPEEAVNLTSNIRRTINATSVDGTVGTFKNTDRVSRKYGGFLRKSAARGKISHDNIPSNVVVSFINEGFSNNIKKELHLGVTSVTGLRELRLKGEDVGNWDAIRLVFSGGFISPVRYTRTGEQEIRFYRDEWKNNPVPDCIMNVHAIRGPTVVDFIVSGG